VQLEKSHDNSGRQKGWITSLSPERGVAVQEEQRLSQLGGKESSTGGGTRLTGRSIFPGGDKQGAFLRRQLTKDRRCRMSEEGKEVE